MQRHAEIAAASGRPGRGGPDGDGTPAGGEADGGAARAEGASAGQKVDGAAAGGEGAPTGVSRAGAGGVGGGADALPVALLAVTVNGRCRERSPADLALFGPAGDGFLDRFVDRHLGQGLFSRAVKDETAESWAVLKTAGGPMGCRVSLWRQRGGERIRVVAAIAPESAVGAAAVVAAAPLAASGAEAPALPSPGRMPWERYAPLLSRSAGAVLDVLDTLRRATKRADRLAVEDALAGVWRVMGLSEELARRARLAEGDEAAAAAALPLPGAGAAPSEIDPVRLLARLMRLAAGDAARRQVRLVLPGAVVGEADAGAHAAPPVSVLADAAALWSALEGAIGVALEAAGAGGEVRGRIEAREHAGLRLCLEVTFGRGAVPEGDEAAAPCPTGVPGATGEAELLPSAPDGALAGLAAYAATAGARFEVVARGEVREIGLLFPERAVLWRL
ncbi:MAG: hypothetical protein AAFP17_07305 [Pseudomonadota bacterium]